MLRLEKELGFTFLCLRRGVSSLSESLIFLGDFSLPTQRCFSPKLYIFFIKTLFSAYAEVFPKRVVVLTPNTAFLCLRRGVSAFTGSDGELSVFSLPTQRCFPTYDQCRDTG